MSTKMKTMFVVNPISGTRDKEDIVAAIPQYLDSSVWDVRVKFTRYAGHATELTRRAVRMGYDLVVAVGGDGTVNEVARSLVDTRTALGIIPCGSGNGLARHLAIPLDYHRALATIERCRIEAMDYGRICDHPFFCTCGIGFDAEVSHAFANAGSRGLVTYLKTTILKGVRYKGEEYEYELNDSGTRHHVKAWLIACGNAAQYGNDTYIAPHASMQDGLLDVNVMTPFPLFESPLVGIQLLTKSIDKNLHVNIHRCKSITIYRQSEGVIHYDGDAIMAPATVRVEIIPRGISMVVGERGKQPI